MRKSQVLATQNTPGIYLLQLGGLVGTGCMKESGELATSRLTVNSRYIPITAMWAGGDLNLQPQG